MAEEATAQNDQTSETSSSEKSCDKMECCKTMFFCILERVKLIALKPKEAWEQIKSENTDVKEIYKKYLVPLAAVSIVASFLGMQIVGISIPFIGTFRPPFFSSLVNSIVQFVLMLGYFYLGAIVISKLAPKFEGQENVLDAFKLIAFAGVLPLAAGVLYIIPALGLLVIPVGLYSLYIYYLGVTPMTAVPEAKRIVFTIVSMLAIIVTCFVIGLIVALILPSTGPDVAQYSGEVDVEEGMRKLAEFGEAMKKLQE